MAGPTNARTDLHRWHGLLEHYTPDGALGRLLLAALALPVSVSALALAVFGIASFTLAALAALLGAGVGVGTAVLTVVALWPVYLSLIGNVESARAYPERSETAPPSEADDPETVLKRKYVEGELSRSEFERRLDGLVGADATRSPPDRTGGGRDGEPARDRREANPNRETERN